MTIPLRMVLRCIWIMVDSKCGISALRVGRRLNANGRTMRHGTILNLTHRIRKAMREPHPLPFEGPVEIDEAKVRLKDGVVYLIGAYDHATRRVYIEMMDGPANREEFRAFIERVSRPGSRVDTDGTAAWPPDIDRIHGTVIHKILTSGTRRSCRAKETDGHISPPTESRGVGVSSGARSAFPGRSRASIFLSTWTR